MTAAVFYPEFPGVRDPARRLALALVLSAAAHLLLAGSLALDVAWPAARLMPPGVLTVRIESSPPELRMDAATPPVPAAIPAGRGRDTRKLVRAEEGAKQEAKTVLVLPQAPDPTYYSAQDLDSYPRLTAPLELDRLAGGAEGNAAGSFRFQLLIDEQGGISEISALEGEPRELREELKTLLAATRFVPGQKDGRPVKSRVTLNVGLAAARRESAGR
jgi:hypothetical protein